MNNYTVVSYRENRLSDYGYDAHNSDQDIEFFETPEAAAEAIATMRFNDEIGQSVPHCDRFHEWEITLLINGIPEEHWFDSEEAGDQHQLECDKINDLAKRHLETLRSEHEEKKQREREAKRRQRQKESAKKAEKKEKHERAEYERLKAKFEA